jgi:hypothetical protein
MKLFICFIVVVVTLFLNKDNFGNDNDIEIVVSRYSENLSWLDQKPFNQYPVIVYNKGINNKFLKTDKIIKVVNVKNVGRCDHTYLYHIIKNYDNLANVTVFLPGSVNLDYKKSKASRLLGKVAKHNSTVFFSDRYAKLSDLYPFTLDTYQSRDKSNLTTNMENILEKSSIRPFGKWFETRFPNYKQDHIYCNFYGIFAVSRENILQHPKSYYQELIKELSNTSNPEVGHYYERAWYAVFYPYTNKNLNIVSN